MFSLPCFPITEIDTTDQYARISSKSIFPILMYDSDIGFGFGGKGIIKNQFRKNESLDLLLFGSSKGEQWYVFTFSIPDFEIRQGISYLLALDIKVEFNKRLKSNFFGFGNDSEDNNWQFPHEKSKLELTAGRGFTERIVGEIGLSFNYISVYDFNNNSLLTTEVPGTGENFISLFTAKIRWDSRDSQINPQKGWKFGVNSDFATKLLGSDFDYQRFRLELSNYQRLFTSSYILAWRIWVQHVEGIAPYFEQSILGGGWTLRGFKADRFIDHAFALCSAEFRFSIYKKIGGVMFFDTGRVFPSIEKANFLGWKSNLGGGLRYYLTNFVVRFDAGKSNEGTRIFFNFGHVF